MLRRKGAAPRRGWAVTRGLIVVAVAINGVMLLMVHKRGSHLGDAGGPPTLAPPSSPVAVVMDFWASHRRSVSYARFDAPMRSASDERHAAAVAAMRGTGMRCVESTSSFRGTRVLVTGLSRSGSTWQYNAVKKILERAVGAARDAQRLEPPDGDWAVRSAHADADSEKFDACLEGRVCVLKTHIFVPRLLLRVDVVLSSHRDVRDVVLSSMLMFGACYAPIGETRTQRSHGVAPRFQQYAHWAPYVCYDMTYEVMMANRTAEVQRLARAALRATTTTAGNSFLARLAARVDPAAVVSDVEALSSRRPESCVGSSNKRTGRGAPRECWDTKSGFARSHVHESTSKPMAWTRRVVLDEVQRRVPTCDVFISLRRVVQGFGGWLVAHGYAIKPPHLDAAESRRRDADFLRSLPSDNNNNNNNNKESETTKNAPEEEEEEEEGPSWIKTAVQQNPPRRRLLGAGDSRVEEGNSFVESLPEAAHLMDPELRLARGGFPALFPRFVHVVNPFSRRGPHPTTTVGDKPVDEDEIAHASLVRAWKLARWYGVDVEIAAALREGDADLDNLASRWPTRRACVSENGIDTKNGMRLPALRDLLACADANDSGAQFVVLTNPDILVHHHFYLRLYQLVLDERVPFGTAWSITRRQIAPRNFADIAEILASAGEPHLGHDTFVFPRAWIERLDAATLVPGFSPWGGAFLTMLAHVGRAVVLGDKRWTFHLAADGPPASRGADETRAAAAAAALRDQLLAKRAEVCENAPGTLFNARAAAAALASTLGEATSSRCCCALDAYSAPHATTRMPGPNSYRVLDMLSGPKRPPVKPLGLQSYEYVWDRLGPDMTLARCAALPGIQLLPIDDLSRVVKKWCQKRGVACPGTPANSKRPRTTDCARSDARPTFEAELADGVATRGDPLTALVVYEKLPTPFEGGHVRVRQLLSWLCYQGHRVLLVHRDASNSHQGRFLNVVENGTLQQPGEFFLPLPVDVGVPGCSFDNLAVFAVDETMRAMTARELARQRVDIAFVTVWFYRTEAQPIPAVALPVLSKLSRLRQRKIKVALVSDDVQYERALAVGKSRGDDPDYWRKVRHQEMEFYSDPTVDIVLAISDDDKDAFAELQRLRRRLKNDEKRRRSILGGRDWITNNNASDWRRRKRRQLATPPEIGVLPYVARVDGGTTNQGWEAHARSGPRRKDLVFVGGGTFSNRAAVRWLVRAALPAVAALPDEDGGCPELRRARLVLVGTAAWAEEAKKACTEAREQRKVSLVDLLCDPAAKRTTAKRFGKWEAPGVAALGRVDSISPILRKAKLFVAPAIVASGISTKVWLALEHGLPVATSYDGTRGLPKDVRDDAERNDAPWTLVGRPPTRNYTGTPKDILSRESARAFARDVSRVYCDDERWRRHATASIALAKRLESREAWSGADSKLAALFEAPPELRCIDDLHDKRAGAGDGDLQESLLDEIQARFTTMNRRAGGCLELARAGL
ncbi:hypothetical protein CTAYLR_005333 [Chrysophaeum taylorii]|uniref:Uncharacterized protein n=1 Tax=Chrysophaeum taylorii TaxID=2483200 RepID=A0AAD7U6Q6_9STRA|nr:hypothetical protein CTAYLR_005333 [Chrysophaeum taylorii]